MYNLPLFYLFVITFSNAFANHTKRDKKIQEAVETAGIILREFFSLFNICVKKKIPSLNFVVDDTNRYINIHSRTTVGFAPKFTANRKFFANLVASLPFREMLELDMQRIKSSLVLKARTCRRFVMDRTDLQFMRDHEPLL